MYKRGRPLVIVGMLLAASLALATPQTKDTKDIPPAWKIDYHEAGGLDGRVLFLTLTPDGTVDTKGGLSTASWESVFQISAEQLAEVQSIVEGFKLAGTPKSRTQGGQPIPDMVYITLDVVKDKKKYPIEPAPPKLVAILRTLIAQGKKQAEDEKWRKAGDFKLGRVWHVSEEVRDDQGIWHGELWEGTWTRQADAKTFDAVWRNNKSHQEVRDTVELDSAERGWIMLHRTSSKISYKGYYQADKQNDLTGYVSSCPTCSWRTQIEY